MDTTTIKLSRPIRVGNEERSELTIKEPELGALKGLQLEIPAEGGLRLRASDLIEVIAALAAIPPSSAHKIALRDLTKFRPIVNDFFTDVLGDGGS